MWRGGKSKRLWGWLGERLNKTRFKCGCLYEKKLLKLQGDQSVTSNPRSWALEIENRLMGEEFQQGSKVCTYVS
jgi:hypothetical protein